jgi:hypothetical protein
MALEFCWEIPFESNKLYLGREGKELNGKRQGEGGTLALADFNNTTCAFV